MINFTKACNVLYCLCLCALKIFRVLVREKLVECELAIDRFQPDSYPLWSLSELGSEAMLTGGLV
jgi:hypothetical protein